MNNMERIQATLAGEPIDRRAVSLTLSLYGARLTSCDLREYYTNPSAYARGQSAVREIFQPDVLFAPFALSLLGAAFGSEVRFFDDHPPNLARTAIPSVREIDRLEVPDVNENPQLTYFRESLRLMAEECGREIPVAAVALSPVDLPAMILGIESWLETLLFDKEGARRILDITTPHFIQWVNALLSDGAACIVLPVPFTNPKIVPRATARDIAVPAMRVAFEQVKGPMILHHVGARINPYLDLLMDMSNVAAFCVDSQDDLAESRKIVGPGPTLMGKIDGPSLHTRDAANVREECLSVLRDRRDDPRFILASSAADIDFHTPPENIHAFREAAEEFSREDAE